MTLHAERLGASIEDRSARLEVRSGAKRPTAPGYNHHSHVVVGVGPVERVDELLEHGLGKCIQSVWSIKSDRCDPVRTLEADRLIALGLRLGDHRRQG